MSLGGIIRKGTYCDPRNILIPNNPDLKHSLSILKKQRRYF